MKLYFVTGMNVVPNIFVDVRFLPDSMPGFECYSSKDEALHIGMRKYGDTPFYLVECETVKGLKKLSLTPTSTLFSSFSKKWCKRFNKTEGDICWGFSNAQSMEECKKWFDGYSSVDGLQLFAYMNGWYNVRTVLVEDMNYGAIPKEYMSGLTGKKETMYYILTLKNLTLKSKVQIAGGKQVPNSTQVF